MMRERDLARARDAAAADHRRHARRVVRCAERPLCHEAAIMLQKSRDAVNLRNLKRFLGCQRGQNRAHAPREHRLAAARYADHQHIVAARRRDFERPLGRELPLHVGEIIRPALPVTQKLLRLGRCELLFAFEERYELRKRRNGIDREPLHEQCLICIRGRNEDGAEPLFFRRDCHRQHALHGTTFSFERELRRKQAALDFLHRKKPMRREKTHGDGQIEAGAVLANVGRREVDRDFFLLELEPRILDGRAHALFALAHRRIRQADDVERRQSVPRIDFHVDDEPVHAKRRRAIRFCKHPKPPITFQTRPRSGAPSMHRPSSHRPR